MKVSSCSAAAFTSSFATNALRFPFNNHHSSSLSFFCWKRSISQFPIRRSSTSPSSSSAADYSSMSNESAIKPKQQQPWLIVGLGNPGKKYQGTRHNVGFEMVDAIANAEGISISSVSFRALFGKDLPFAKLRLLPKGGHGGHNGMRSVIDHFKGSRDFPRLRVGIGRPPGKMDTVNFVLRPFNKQEREELDFTFQHGTDAIRILLLEGFNRSATFVNSARSMEQCS